MIPLTPRQEALIAGRELATAVLIQLTTYTDRDAGTVGTVYRFADRSTRYGGQEWEGVIEDLGVLVSRMNHVPTPSGLSALERSCSFTLANAPGDDGRSLLERLRDSQVETADVELWQLPFDPRREGPHDFTSLVGDEHLVLYRGMVAEVTAVTQGEMIDIACTTNLPQLDFTAVENQRQSREDTLRRAPVMFGFVERYPLVGYSVPHFLRLREDVQDSATPTFEAANTPRFSAEYADVGQVPYRQELLVGKEHSWVVDITEISDSVLSCVTVSRNRPRIHASGVPVIAGDSPDFYEGVWADRSVPALGPSEIYVKDARGGDLYATDADDWNLAQIGTDFDGVVVPSSKEFKSIVKDFALAAEVTQQPEYTSSATNPSTVRLHPCGLTAIRVSGSTEHGDWSSLGNFPYNWDNSVPANNEEERARTGCGGSDIQAGTEEVLEVQARIRATIVSRSAGADIRVVGRMKDVFGISNLKFDYVFDSSEVGSQEQFSTSWTKVDQGTWTNNDLRADIGGTLQDDDPRIEVAITFESGGEPTCVVEINAAEFRTRSRVPTSSDVNQTVEAAISAGADVVSRQVYADGYGGVVPAADTDYTVGEGEAVRNAPDIWRLLLREKLGLPATAIDETSWALVETALGSNNHGFNLWDLGFEITRVVSALEYETRCQLVPAERASGTVYRLLSSDASYQWPAAVATITEWQDFGEEGRTVPDLFTRIRAFYRPDRSVDDLSNLFAEAMERWSTPAENVVGRRDHPGMEFLSVLDAATMQSVVGFYVRELSRLDGRTYYLQGVPWTEAGALEVGDTVNVTPPWESTQRLCRVIQVERTFAQGGATNLRLAGV